MSYKSIRLFVVAVSAGCLYTSAIQADGALKFSGDNRDGQCDALADLGPCRPGSASDKWLHS